MSAGTLAKTQVVIAASMVFNGCVSIFGNDMQPYYHHDPAKYEEIVSLKRPVDYPTNDYITLSNKYGKVVVSRFGAQVISYVPAGDKDVLFMPDDRDFTKNREMHGGIPVCWPWFSLAGGPMTQQHGFARYSDWIVDECYNGDDFSRLRLVLTSDSETKKLWPFDFKLTYDVELSDRLAVRLNTANTADPKTDSGKWFEITEGLHTYFRVGDVDGAVLRSVDGFWTDPEGPTDKSAEVKGDIKLSPKIAGTYFSNWPGDYILFDDVENRKIAISFRGNRDVVIWNPGRRTGDGNLGENDYRNLICIEPANANKWHPIRVNPGRSHAISMTIMSFVKSLD